MPSPSESAPATHAWHVPPHPSAAPAPEPQLGVQHVPHNERNPLQLVGVSVAQSRGSQQTPKSSGKPKRAETPRPQTNPAPQPEFELHGPIAFPQGCVASQAKVPML